jgi:cytochrome c553
MGQAARDPLFHAQLAIAEQDAADSGELCIRCHSPGGWLAGRSDPTDGSALVGADFEGVTCNFCHRLVDPVFDPAENPNPTDQDILNALAQVPTEPGSGQFVVDPQDRRRGPFDLGPPFTWHLWEKSPYHQESLLCATCHDVSNPAYERSGGRTPAAGDRYLLGDLDEQHPTHSKYDQFPIERTYSEWLQSAFAVAPIEMGGRYGGNKTAVSTCQDCHMPDATGTACLPGLEGAIRDDLPRHDFNGANTWVLNAILELDQTNALYGPAEESGLSQPLVDAAIARNLSMLERASDLSVAVEGGRLETTITNQTGHKLPTGYPEGRRMWINIEWRDAAGAVFAENGHYDLVTAVLDTESTVVYEAKLGIDGAIAAATGLPAGESFHFVLNNVVLKDNRIPPRGFTNSGFESVQAKPVGATYADGQYWDSKDWSIPCGAVEATVRVYFQTSSKEYIEFLRDANTTNSAGQIAYDLWVNAGKSAPALMDEAVVPLGPMLVADAPRVSLLDGGIQNLCLSAGLEHANKVYLMLGSGSGTSPGIQGPGFVLPLNWDSYTTFTLLHPNTLPLVSSLGLLDATGVAGAGFALPANALSGSLAGAVLNHSYLVLDAQLEAEDASGAVSVTLAP